MHAGIPIDLTKILDKKIDERSHLDRQVLTVGIKCVNRKLLRQELAQNWHQSARLQIVKHQGPRRDDDSLPKQGGGAERNRAVGFQISRHLDGKLAFRAGELPFPAAFGQGGSILENHAIMLDQLGGMFGAAAPREIFRRGANDHAVITEGIPR
jgi:hypothetical protein